MWLSLGYTLSPVGSRQKLESLFKTFKRKNDFWTINFEGFFFVSISYIPWKSCQELFERCTGCRVWQNRLFLVLAMVDVDHTDLVCFTTARVEKKRRSDNMHENKARGLSYKKMHLLQIHKHTHWHVQPGAVKLVLWCHWMAAHELRASSDVREPISLHQVVHNQQTHRHAPTPTHTPSHTHFCNLLTIVDCPQISTLWEVCRFSEEGRSDSMIWGEWRKETKSQTRAWKHERYEGFKIHMWHK